jgi:hypothetical protein
MVSPCPRQNFIAKGRTVQAKKGKLTDFDSCNTYNQNMLLIGIAAWQLRSSIYIDVISWFSVRNPIVYFSACPFRAAIYFSRQPTQKISAFFSS